MKKHIFSLWNWLTDSLEQMIQLAALAITAFFPFKFDFQSVVKNEKPGMKLQELVTYYALRHGNICIAILLIVLMIALFHKINSDNVLNTGNRYHRRTKIEYWLYSRVLGYKKCSLIRVPIVDQFRLIMSDLFPEYICGEYEEAKDDEEIKTRMFGDALHSQSFIITSENTSNESYISFKGKDIYLAISDTYPITEAMLPEICTLHNTAIVQRMCNKDDNNRYASKALVKEVRHIVKQLNGQKIVHIFSTTNPYNTRLIVDQVFKTAGRDNIEHLYVHEQLHKTESDWSFLEKCKKIF
jgi:hypothetical protein